MKLYASTKRDLEKTLGYPEKTLDKIVSPKFDHGLSKIYEKASFAATSLEKLYNHSSHTLGISGGSVIIGLFNQLATATPHPYVTAIALTGATVGVVGEGLLSLMRMGERQSIIQSRNHVDAMLEGKLPALYKPCVWENEDGELVMWNEEKQRTIQLPYAVMMDEDVKDEVEAPTVARDISSGGPANLPPSYERLSDHDHKGPSSKPPGFGM